MTRVGLAPERARAAKQPTRVCTLPTCTRSSPARRATSSAMPSPSRPSAPLCRPEATPTFFSPFTLHLHPYPLPCHQASTFTSAFDILICKPESIRRHIPQPAASTQAPAPRCCCSLRHPALPRSRCAPAIESQRQHLGVPRPPSCALPLPSCAPPLLQATASGTKSGRALALSLSFLRSIRTLYTPSFSGSCGAPSPRAHAHRRRSAATCRCPLPTPRRQLLQCPKRPTPPPHRGLCCFEETAATRLTRRSRLRACLRRRACVGPLRPSPPQRCRVSDCRRSRPVVVSPFL